jgi:hypothetical protein
VVTIRTVNGCPVQSICNWTTQRKYVTTFPSLQYWLSALPFGRMLREAIEGLCCRPFLRRSRPVVVNADNQPNVTDNEPSVRSARAADVSPSTSFHGSTQSTASSRAFLQLALQAVASREGSANAEQLVLGMLGDKDPQGNPALTELETENLLQFLVLDQMAKPVMRNLLGDQTISNDATLRGIGALFGGGTGESPAAEASIGARIDELRATVERQQQLLDELINRPRPDDTDTT